jgi:hypothetical protein
MSFLQFFNIPNNYTLKELREAKNKKIKDLIKLNISMNDKQIYANNIYKIYKLLKGKLLWSNFDNHRNMFFKGLDKFNREYNYSSNIIKQKLLPDKSTIVVEILNKNVNGQIEKIAKAYKINKDGVKQEYKFEDAMKLLEN